MDKDLSSCGSLPIPQKKGILHVYSILSINVQTSLLKTEHFEDGSSVPSIYPLSNKSIKLVLQGEQVIASSFKKGEASNNTIKMDEVKDVLRQANYTNTVLNAIAEQLNHVYVKINAQKKEPILKLQLSHIIFQNLSSTLIVSLHKMMIPFLKVPLAVVLISSKLFMTKSRSRYHP